MVMTKDRKGRSRKAVSKDSVKRSEANSTNGRFASKRNAFQLRYRGNHLQKPVPFLNEHNKLIKPYKSYKAEYLERIRYAPKIDARQGGGAPPICFSSIGTGRALRLRPLGQLPPHIIEALNDHYLQLTHGMMVPEADLYNNDDQPVEYLFPSVINKREYQRLINEAGSEQSKRVQQMNAQKSLKPPQPQPYSAQHMVNGEIIGVFVIYGNGKITRAVCSKTREVFTAHVLPDWKTCRVMDVIRRLQVPDDKTSLTADEIRLSELCVSKRTEIIKSNDRYIIFTPTESNTIHSYGVERLDQITEKEAMDIYKKVVEIVRFCHARNVLVRNFKTRNFYLTKSEDGEFIVRPCYIQDMCCEEDDSDSQFTRRQVCVAFMAPEMLSVEAKPLHSRSTDIWGLGVLLYILLIGKYPFHNDKLPLLFRAIKLERHRWPTNFLSPKTRKIVDQLLLKPANERLKLETLWRETQCPFQDIRCRSNLVLKQRDLIIKCNMFKMYWDTYKNQLLPQNVNPIHEELQSCKRDLPVITELAKRDMRLIEEAIKFHRFQNVTGYHEAVMESRLQQINNVLLEREIQEATQDRRELDPCQLQINDVSKELLLPASIYPISEHYHPSQRPVDWIVYMALRDANQLEFPPIYKNFSLRIYPAPVFLGENIHPHM